MRCGRLVLLGLELRMCRWVVLVVKSVVEVGLCLRLVKVALVVVLARLARLMMEEAGAEVLRMEALDSLILVVEGAQRVLLALFVVWMKVSARLEVELGVSFLSVAEVWVWTLRFLVDSLSRLVGGCFLTPLRLGGRVQRLKVVMAVLRLVVSGLLRSVLVVEALQVYWELRISLNSSLGRNRRYSLLHPFSLASAFLHQRTILLIAVLTPLMLLQHYQSLDRYYSALDSLPVVLAVSTQLQAPEALLRLVDRHSKNSICR